MVLSSKTIEVGLDFTDDVIHTTVLNALPQTKELLGNRILITVETPDKQRGKKQSAWAQLESVAVDGEFNWQQGTYEFRFVQRKFFWKGNEVYITANEALFLYRWLVLHDDLTKLQWYFLRNMRRRLGKDFLMEVQKDVE